MRDAGKPHLSIDFGDPASRAPLLIDLAATCPGYTRHPFMPDWVYEIPLFPVPPNTLDDVRSRIAGMAQKPHAEEFGEAARTPMTRLGTPGICPRRGCARARQCSTPLAYCMFENLDAVQEFIFPLLNARLSNHPPA